MNEEQQDKARSIIVASMETLSSDKIHDLTHGPFEEEQ